MHEADFGLILIMNQLSLESLLSKKINLAVQTSNDRPHVQRAVQELSNIELL